MPFSSQFSRELYVQNIRLPIKKIKTRPSSHALEPNHGFIVEICGGRIYEKVKERKRRVE